MGLNTIVLLLKRSIPGIFRPTIVSWLAVIKHSIYAFAAFPNPAGTSPFQNSTWRRKTLESIKSQAHSMEMKSHFSLELAAEEENPLEVSRDCFRTLGLYPISFSIPLLGQESDWHKKDRILSQVFPGEPYAFDSHEDYMHQYNSSVLGLTHKKGGWDCFRHLEIISAGSLPLMPDILACPRFTMVHYPKSAMLTVLKNYTEGMLPDSSVNTFFFNWAQEHLTSEAMVRNIFQVLRLVPKRVLFLDELLPERADYLSVLTLIGLMQDESYHVDVAYPVDYIFSDWSGDVSQMYGRGFGYTKVLGKSKSKTPWCSIGTCDSPPTPGTNGYYSECFDTMVVGDISANRNLTKMLDSEIGGPAKIYLRGDDLAPTTSEYLWLRSLSGSVFSREIY